MKVAEIRRIIREGLSPLATGGPKILWVDPKWPEKVLDDIPNPKWCALVLFGLLAIMSKRCSQSFDTTLSEIGRESGGLGKGTVRVALKKLDRYGFIECSNPFRNPLTVTLVGEIWVSGL
jgi:hypothetical protein